MKQTGRNDPCPCGSGKKYKKCCLATADEQDSQNRRNRQLEAQLMARLLDYAVNSFGREILENAWDAFNCVEGVAFPKAESAINQLFIPWSLFSCEFEDLNPAGDTFLTIAESFWIDYESELTSDEISWLDAAIGVPFSMYEVRDVVPPDGLKLRDLFTDEEFDVVERSAIDNLETGMVVYCAIFQLGKLSSVLAITPLPLLPSVKADVLEFRKEIAAAVKRDALTWKDVVEYGTDIRRLYFAELLEMLSAPQLRNSDDEAFIPQRINFDLTSVDESYHRLIDLAGAENRQRVLERATFEAGRVVAGDIPWAGGNEQAIEHFGNPVLLGVLKLTAGSLVAEVNSAERAERIRKIIEDRLGALATYKSTKYESIDLPFTDIWRKEERGLQSSRLSGADIVGSKAQPDSSLEDSVTPEAEMLISLTKKQSA